MNYNCIEIYSKKSNTLNQVFEYQVKIAYFQHSGVKSVITMKQLILIQKSGHLGNPYLL